MFSRSNAASSLSVLSSTMPFATDSSILSPSMPQSVDELQRLSSSIRSLKSMASMSPSRANILPTSIGSQNKIPSTSILNSSLISKNRSAGRARKLERPVLASVNNTSLSSFELEYAMLENVLRKDDTVGACSRNVAVEREQKNCAPALLEPEFYFADILGDNGIPPHSLCNMMENGDLISDDGVPLQLRDDAREEICEDSDKIETELSSALASIVESQQAARAERDGGCYNEPENSGSTKGIDMDKESMDNGIEEMEGQEQDKLCRYDITKEYRSFLGLTESKKESVEEEVIGRGANSPSSDISMSGGGVRSHPDVYENLSTDMRTKVDNLRDKIAMMPRRKLRESLAQGVTIEDVEPLMCLNRDELAGMLGLGVTTWKMFLHNTLGVPRWPARALKSQKVKEDKVIEKKKEAVRRGDHEQAYRLERELSKLKQSHLRRRKQFRKMHQGVVKGEGAVGSRSRW